ncbi:hypothetical protein [Mammaliicoccus sciuri]|uniref:hypothetical protein n=1 Tax=Mammaliicoccus sciuri TaxID=1296 RepID=UPI00194F22E8|nr:hypothetical protein [Mammaliicoccus sciuri]
MITKISDENSCFEVGKNNIGYITEWRVDEDVVDIFRIADENHNLIAFKGYVNKQYRIEESEVAGVKKQLSIFNI